MEENSYPPPALSRNEGYFYIQKDVKGKAARIKTADIIYVEGAMNYVVVHLGDGKKEMPHHTLGWMEARLQGYAFTRVHKSYIVTANLPLVYSILPLV